MTFGGQWVIENSAADSVFPMHCPTCKAPGSPLPPGRAEGVYAVGDDGWFRKVAETIGAASREELTALEREVARVAATQDRQAAVQVAESVGWQPPPRKSRLSVGNEALDFLIKLEIVLVLMLKGGEWTVETAQQLLEQWVR